MPSSVLTIGNSRNQSWELSMMEIFLSDQNFVVMFEIIEDRLFVSLSVMPVYMRDGIFKLSEDFDYIANNFFFFCFYVMAFHNISILWNYCVIDGGTSSIIAWRNIKKKALTIFIVYHIVSPSAQPLFLVQKSSIIVKTLFLYKSNCHLKGNLLRVLKITLDKFGLLWWNFFF